MVIELNPKEIVEISARLLTAEAERRGIQCTYMGDAHTVLMERDGASWFTKGSRTSLQSSVGASIADDKLLTKRILAHFGLPTAAYTSISRVDQIEKLSALHFPLVMKPVNAKQAEGVVVGIKDLDTARLHFTRLGRRAIFEEMLRGTEYRVICVDYQFVAAALRRPAFVTGDGVTHIGALIDEKNAHPWRGDGHQANLTRIRVDELVESLLQEQGYDLDSVPAAGVEVVLRKTGNLSTGGEAWDVSAEVSPDNRALFEQIARCCDLDTVGIDVMCRSLQTPIQQQAGAGVIEVNASPGLRMHHYPMRGEPHDVAGLILDMVERHYFPAP